MVAQKVIFELREGTAVEWTSTNPILRSGEPGFEKDTNKLKIGDGFNVWSSLDYITGGGPGSDGASAYEIAVANGFVGTEEEWLESLVGPAGTDGIDGSDGMDGADGAPGLAGETYPLSGYGFHSASVPIETARSDSDHGPSWLTRVWVPAGKAINTIGVYVTIPGSAGSGGNNAFAIYDAAGNFVGSTPIDNNLWLPDHAWTFKNLSSPIAAQGSGRFVYVATSSNGAGNPWIAYLNIGFGENLFKTGLANNPRSIAVGGMSSSFPSTVTVSSGSNFGYVPLVVLA